MPPKFQSSFIPQGPAATTSVIPQAAPASRQHDLLGFLAKLVFTLSLLLAIGVVGYRWYLGYSIRQMSAELEAARQEVSGGQTTDLIRLNDRIVSTQTLIAQHRALTPLFTFLQQSTPQSVTFTGMRFSMEKEGPHVVLTGAAKSYSALAFEASIIEKDQDFVNPVFSDIRLDEKGNVTFSVSSGLAPTFISYEKTVGRASSTPQALLPAATSTATTTATTATTTRAAATSTAKTSTTTSATSTKR